jgi:hypothetical protein
VVEREYTAKGQMAMAVVLAMAVAMEVAAFTALVVRFQILAVVAQSA